MFAWSCLSASAITYPICEEQSGLLVKESVNINRRGESSVRSRGTKRSPRDSFSICQVSLLLSFLMSSSLGSVTCAAVERSKAASGWQTVAIYAPLARSATYWAFVVTPFLFTLRELVKSIFTVDTVPRL